MKLIYPSVEIIEQKPGIQGLYEQIELAARNCYKSEGLIKYDEQGNSITAKGFVNKVVNVYKHQSVAEHGTVYLDLSPSSIILEERKYQDNHYSRYIQNGLGAYVTTNYRVLLENNWLGDLQYMCEPTKYHEKRVCIKFTTDIGVTREANRHRANSPSEQSTRYCNYSKDKFGNEITVCTNVDISKNDVLNAYDKWTYSEEQGTVDYSAFVCMCNTIGSCKEDQFGIIDTWLFANLACEWSYMRLIKLGWAPQQARRVLPLDLSSELIHTAFVSDWIKFFDMRCAENAHPDIRALAITLREEFIKRGYLNE